MNHHFQWNTSRDDVGRKKFLPALLFFSLCFVFCLSHQCLHTNDSEKQKPKWEKNPNILRMLSEISLDRLEKFVDLNDIKLLEANRHLYFLPISSTIIKEEEMKFFEKKCEKSGKNENISCTKEDSSDICDNYNRSRRGNIDSEYEGSQIEREIIYETRFYKELTEEEFENVVNGLGVYVDVKDMNVLWNYVNANRKKKYLNLKEEMWKECEFLSRKYNIPEECTMKAWRKAHLHLKDDLIKKERDDYLDLKTFIDAGTIPRCKYISFLIDKYESWNDLLDMATDSWKSSISSSFDKYLVQDRLEKEID
ncbi:Phist protein [Plasmodium gonderi]|uniref:Phist protein n=1 Tax=Plasmodium gonderi TaxID=77519 RepID=A0A1Y1JCB2_PLAGO|nr:Phist protein [Plasmodium gonderi]GAW79870.1 Phist protein [Plasmodium gonderi]